MFLLEYTQQPNSLSSSFRNIDISNNVQVQFYNPIFSLFFEIDENEFIQNISLNQKYHLYDHTHVIDNLGIKKNVPIFIKNSPLLDPVHYLIGKYQHDSAKQTCLPQLKNNEYCHSKLLSYNNASYIDNFFNYLSSKLLHNYKWIHGIDYYGSNLSIQKRFKFNVFDDMEYLEESDYFMKNNNVKYDIEQLNSPMYLQNVHTKSNRPCLQIQEDISMIDAIEDIEDIEDSKHMDDTITEPEVVFTMEKDDLSESDDSNVSDSSDEEDSDNEVEEIKCDDEEDYEEDDEENDEEDDEDDDEDENDQELFAYLYDFPVQMIALEKCDGTLDSLFEKKSLNDQEICSTLMQIIMTLITYQKTFSFTHNDLHTNNILYKHTEQKFVSYIFNGKHYKVPTYGRIYKIIDFGRSIYKFKGKILCSDSFAPGGDAHSQYNSEPYFNPNKKRLEPNFSFDLCRLGCSLYDFIFPDDINITDEKMTDVQKTIQRWCTDDYGKNVLYKRNGDERYPSFKLYKMISRIVHQHVPEKQLEFPLFSQFESKSKPTTKCMNIDMISTYSQ